MFPIDLSHASPPYKKSIDGHPKCPIDKLKKKYGYANKHFHDMKPLTPMIRIIGFEAEEN